MIVTSFSAPPFPRLLEDDLVDDIPGRYHTGPDVPLLAPSLSVVSRQTDSFDPIRLAGQTNTMRPPSFVWRAALSLTIKPRRSTSHFCGGGRIAVPGGGQRICDRFSGAIAACIFHQYCCCD